MYKYTPQGFQATETINTEAVVFYHSADADGNAAALAASEALGDRATYVPINYARTLKDYLKYDLADMVTGRDTYALDFSFPYPIHVELGRLAKTLTILDHHESAAQRLGIEISTKLSGCGLAWEYFHPDQTMPDFYRYVQDRDLWEFKLPYSKAINLAIKNNFAWDLNGAKLARSLPNFVECLRRVGEHPLEVQQGYIEKVCDRAIEISLNGYKVPCVQVDRTISEVCHHLCDIYPDAPFSVNYRINKSNQNEYRWDLRSTKGAAQAVAESFGGGGHPNAAGFITPTIEVVSGFSMVGDRDPSFKPSDLQQALFELAQQGQRFEIPSFPWNDEQLQILEDCEVLADKKLLFRSNQQDYCLAYAAGGVIRATTFYEANLVTQNEARSMIGLSDLPGGNLFANKNNAEDNAGGVEWE